MIVIANTSPLNYLIILKQANLLQQLYGRVLVPNAVLLEMQHPEAPVSVRTWASAPPAWLETRHIVQLVPDLNSELGPGESEAISLALELHADLLLIDERAGRLEAETRQIPVAGTLAVLLQAALRGLVDFPDALQKLRHQGFRISRTIEIDMLERFARAKTK